MTILSYKCDRCGLVYKRPDPASDIPDDLGQTED